jgi:hypothetical protein
MAVILGVNAMPVRRQEHEKASGNHGHRHGMRILLQSRMEVVGAHVASLDTWVIVFVAMEGLHSARLASAY